MSTFQSLTTHDGSPTLIDPVSGQTMHAREGALSETLYIYGDAYLKNREIDAPHSAVIVGLGLGYIELVILGLWLRNFSLHAPPTIISFENNKALRNNFVNWLRGSHSETLSGITNSIASRLGLEKINLQKSAKDSFAEGRWQILEDVEFGYKQIRSSGLICYDPYSSSASPQLWSVEFLTDFISKCADTKSVFATYASNGRIKKALLKNGFSNLGKKGYQYKKESTLGVRI